ncbi:MAG: PD-(D/E)XK nuclease family protein [Geobacteraceae bacterium]|nr:PD-(D/E)XK nuclease family protein [Geobacteraceae bacterium]
MSGILYILPATAAVDAFTRRAVTESGVLFGTPALTLRRLAEEIFAVAGDERRPISNVGRRLLLGEVVRERYRDGAGHFAPLREFPGFVGALDSLFAELKQALVAPELFAAVIRRLPGSGRLAELASLYREYDAALAGRALRDRHDMELAALSHLRAGGAFPPMFDGVAAICCRDIYDLTPLQLALLAELSRRLPVELHLPWNPERGTLYGYVGRTADAVEALDNSDLQLEPVFAEPAGPFLTPFLAALFGGERGESGPPGAMALIAAPGPYRECEEIGRRIRGLLEEGIDPAAVAVLFRDIQGYGPMMEDVCRRYRIPVSYRRGAPLFTSPLVRACLAPFAVVRSRFGREELLALVKSTYVDGSRFGVSADAVEEVLLASGYIDETLGGVEAVLGRRIAFLQRLGKPWDKGEAVLRALQPLLGELQGFRKKKTLAEFAELLERFIERHRIFRRGIAAADPRALKRDASAVTLLRQVLRDLEKDMVTIGLAAEPLEPGDFVTLLKQGMEGAYLAGERGGGVAILNFHDARGLGFDHLFIGGLNEGICPLRHDGHPLFKDSDKLLFQRASGSRPFRTSREKGEEEPLLFWLATGCAGKSLTFSYSYLDGRGSQMLRSPFLEELLAKVPLAEERVPVNRLTPEPALCLEREELLNALALCRLPLPEDGPDPLVQSLARIEANAGIEAGRERFFQAEQRSARAALSSPHTGTLARKDIVAELRAWYESPEGSRFAPTTLEEYGCCPFRYFLRRLLRLSPVEKPEMELAARDEGSLVHEILCAFFRRLREEGRLPLRDAALARETMREEAERIFAAWEGERNTGEPLLWEIEKGKILSLLARVAELEAADDSALVPDLFEHPFADLEVADDDGSRIFLTGKIDRIDVAAGDGRLRVVDYKLAGDRGKYGALLKKEHLGETSFQMPVYLLAAARALEEAGGPAVTRFSARYLLLRKLDRLDKEFTEGKEDFTGFFSADPAERRLLGDGNFLNRLCGKVRAMKGGDFQITPKECEFCDFGSVCRYVEVGVREEG